MKSRMLLSRSRLGLVVRRRGVLAVAPIAGVVFACSGPSNAAGSDAPGATKGDGGEPQCIEIMGGDWSSFPLRNYWRDERGLHWVAKRNQEPLLLLESYDPATGEQLASTTYPILDRDQGHGALHGVAHSPDGVVAVSFSVPDDEYLLHHYVMLTTLDDPDVYDVFELPWDPEARANEAFLGWDGEEFVWHGFVFDADDRVLAVARLDETGKIILPLTVVGPPSTSIAGGFDMVTDPESGTTWMTAPGGRASRVTGTRRNGSPLTSDGEPRIIGLVPGPGPPDAAHVSLGRPGEAMFTFTVFLDGLVAQLGDQRLSELGKPIRLPNQRKDSIDFLYYETAAAYSSGTWWLFTQSDVNLEAHRVDGRTVAESIEVVHYSDNEFDDPGGDATGLSMNDLSTFVYKDEVWLGVEDRSAEQLDGPICFRVLRFEPGCVYASLYDRWLAGETF